LLPRVWEDHLVNQKQPEAKRPYFTAVLLVLLLASVMGNVALYSKSISQQQEERIQRGFVIMQSGSEAKKHFASVTAHVQALLASDDIADRLLLKSKLAASFHNAKSVSQFIAEAEVSHGESYPAPHRKAEEFLADTELSFEQLGNHDGPLTGGEREYLELVKSVYTKLTETLESFDYENNNTDRAIALTVQAGGKWVDQGGELLAHMNEPASVAFVSRQ